MANILFKRGEQAALNTLKTNNQGIDGAFYLTEDTHRLYAGIGNKIVDLNQYIQIVETADDLNALTNVQLGDFVYINAGNILAVYREDPNSPTNPKPRGWAQINKNTDTVNTGLAFTGDDASDPGTLTLTLTDSEGHPVDADVKFLGTKGVDVTVAADGTVTIEGNPYTLGVGYTETGDGKVTAMTVTLDSEDEEVEDTNFNITAGKNITFDKTANGIKINGTDAASFNKAPDKSYLDVDGGTPTLKLTLGNGEDITLSDANSLYYTYGKTGSKTVYNQGKLDVYTTSEVDDKLKDLNPMTYKGPVDSASLPTDVSIGDTYMASASFDIKLGAGNIISSTGEDQTVKVGDLFIATGTEDASTGKITASTLKWTYIPAGDDSQTDTVYTYSLNTADHILSIQESTSGDVIAHIDVDNTDNKLVLTSTSDTAHYPDVNVPWKLQINHAKVTREDHTSSAPNVDNFTVIDTVNTDETGHVLGVNVKTVTVHGYNLSGAEVVDAATKGNGVTVTDTLKNTSGDPAGTSVFKVETNNGGDNLKVSKNTAGDGFKISMEWGSF